MKYRRLVRGVIALAAASMALAPVGVGAAGATWEPWQSVKGVFDVDGPRTDGSYVVAGAGALYLLDAEGKLTPFSRGPGGYHNEDVGGEAYIAVSHGGHMESAGCDFTPDETFILRLHTPLGVNRVSADGEESGSFANLTGVTSLGGLAFDSTGAFDHGLLATGLNKGKTSVFEIDCNGGVKVLTRTAPTVEGGLAVAPTGFGGFGGQLIAPDELSGKIYAIGPTGTATLVARPRLATGGDIGVESVGFVPDGFTERGGAVYYADRFTARNKHPGSDRLLRLQSSALSDGLVQDGDLLVATEGAAKLIAIRCTANCITLPIVSAETKAHGEGHIAFQLNPAPTPAPTPVAAKPKPPVVPQAALDFVGYWGIPAGVGLLLVLFIAAVAAQALRHRTR